MERVVVRIQRGITAGKYRARFENYGKHILVGVADTEEKAWKLFDNFTDDFPETKAKEKVEKILISKTVQSKKISKEEWKKRSREQIKILSAKYR